MEKKQPKTKKCHKCGKRKPRSSFYQNPDTKDGLRRACRVCDADYRRKRAKRKDQYGKLVRRNNSYKQVHPIRKGAKQKMCSRCGKRKPRSSFYRNPDTKDGLRNACRVCDADYRRKRNKRKDQYGKPVRRYNSYEQVHRIRKGAKQKMCIKCKKWKPYSHYYKFCESKDGVGQYCKTCAYEKARKRYKEHKLNEKRAGKKRK